MGENRQSADGLEPPIPAGSVDPVTGLADRVLFQEQAEERWQYAARLGKSLALILISIDRFRECGRTAAEVCLRSIGNVLLTEYRRPKCLVGRVRDHQMAILITDEGPRDALASAQKLCESIEGLQLQPTATGGAMTVSAGVAATVPSAKRPLESLFIAADNGLRRAWRDGGNCARPPDKAPRQ